MAKRKYSNKFLSIVGAMTTLFFVVGTAGAAFYVSNQLKTRDSVAPNAPESEPMAFSCNEAFEGNCGAAGGCAVGKKCRYQQKQPPKLQRQIFRLVETS